MLHETPLRKQHESYVSPLRVADPGAAAHRPGAAVGQRRDEGGGVEYVAWGPPGPDGGAACELPSTFGEVEAEYAVLRRGAGMIDCPHRGTIRVTGADRGAFLQRMVTQELEGQSAGDARASFWLNRKGRIDADLLLVELGDSMLIDVDIHQATETTRGLSEFVIADDVAIDDVSTDWHHLAMHGPGGLEVLASAAGVSSLDLAPGRAARVVLDGVETIVVRRDEIGEIGLLLFAPFHDAPRVWAALGRSGPDPGGLASRIRPVGWYAFNIARIEAGTPLFNIDYGSTNLPHETGVIEDRVNFTKGCYLGQEIVARIESLGQPKQILRGLRVKEDLLPVAGGQVFAPGEELLDDPIGLVTSSTLGPMLGGEPIAFAMMRTTAAGIGATVRVNAEGEQGTATVVPLRFLGSSHVE